LFSKILIANRGEIAVRIIRTARPLGIATVAVYSDVERSAPHVELADEAVPIGPPPAATSYLVVDNIIAACRKTGAEAVHPGYGFLSERAVFAEALAQAGIVFIGPNAQAIAAMGDKIASKKLAAAAGVSTIPGHLAAIDSAEEAIAAAEGIGFPVIIKASAGGGGKGMRVVGSAAEVKEGWLRARSEARSAFGDERVFIEKYIESPRHIEIQVLGDKHGNIIHLGERECSVQRRNQKVIEEAPSSAVDAGLRAQMGAEAVSLARAVGYDSAGTVEFVMGTDRRFYFLEMNTRLQVEHPVTELVTGLDLVAEMIRIAAGEKLTLSQEDVRLTGSAIEARLYAENPYRDFLPSTGRLTRYRPPAEASDGAIRVRVDDGVVEGSEITIHFDPLVAKLITHGRDRDEATAAMADALDRFVIDGIEHNQPFLAALIGLPRWRAGRLSTGLIAEEFPGGFKGVAPSFEGLTRLAVIALSIDLTRRERLRGLPGRVRDDRQREEWIVRIGEEKLRLRVLPSSRTTPIALSVILPGMSEPVAAESDWRLGEALWSGTVAGLDMTVQVRPSPVGIRLSWRGVDVTAQVMTPHIAELQALMPARKAANAAKYLRCPMPGLVVSIAVKAGQKVHSGDTLCIVEAMKMENVLRAERDARVARVDAKPGDVLAVDAVIMEFE
jgi:propionyl-CoA carboxylase alpha chain